jgi:hypothetical protein
MQASEYRALLASLFGGRRWIVASDVLAGATPLVAALESLGAERCLCVATSRGTGPVPDERFAPAPIVVPVVAPDMMTGIRRSLAALADLPEDARRRVDAFDPEGRARVLGTIFDDGRPVAGRAKYGARPAAWQALEDKTRIEAFWDQAGVARAPSRIVPVEAEALRAASAALDAGNGCAWAGDSRDGFNGGAAHLRWVRTAADAEEACAFFGAHAAQVRVMPFLEGIPCSIHGFVLPGRTIALRPCEMLVFQRPGSSQLHYARAATFWDPSAEDREAMREAARLAGEELRRGVGYRGAFTVDGVLTRDGFRPTELNPRFGAALAIMMAGLDLPLLLLNAAVVEGETVDLRPAELEALLLTHADTHRAGGGMATTSVPQTETRTATLRWQDGVFVVVNDGAATWDATATLGPSTFGGFARVDLNPATTPVGPSAAPRVAASLACIDAHWKLGLGPLSPALDVRAG